jgi:hypothetical protein
MTAKGVSTTEYVLKQSYIQADIIYLDDSKLSTEKSP